MTLEINIPKNLENEYYSIEKMFSKISDQWKKYNDEIIPTDSEFAIRIIDFLIKVINYAQENYNEIDAQKLQKFIGFYHINFYYGPNGDNKNYIDFDEGSIYDVFNEFMDEDHRITIKILRQKKEELEQIKNNFSKN